MQADSPTPVSITIPDLLQGAWTSMIVLTYGANLGFLESRLLSQLAQIPLRIILADNKSLQERLLEAATTGQRLRTNRAYVAGPIRHPRAAHAKAILLADSQKGLLLVGSGNLGQDGYASPGELWHVFAYEDGQREHLAEFLAVRSLIGGLASRGALDIPTQQILGEVWSRSAWLDESVQSLPAVRHNLELPILDQLAAEVTWKVQEMTAYAPFHDSECAALAELVQRFKPRRLRVLIRGDTSVDADRLRAVVSASPNAQFMSVVVAQDPSTYLHAKWVHLVGSRDEAMLSGSANLSRPAMLNSAETGNVELGVITKGHRGDFDYLYDPLLLTTIEDPEVLGVTFKASETPPIDDSGPVLLWSRLNGHDLALMFDRPIDLDLELTLVFSDSVILLANARVDGSEVLTRLTPQDATKLSEGGPFEVRLSNEKNGHFTWPYHVAALLGRLDRAANRDVLSSAGNLPEADAELFELLQALESTLIFDPESVWRLARPQTEIERDGSDGQHLRWQDLDWERVQRDPRYRGYHFRGATQGLPPTEIQILLAAISGKLGELSDADLAASAEDVDDESSLARESDQPADAEADDDEMSQRRLSIRTRTRMAFNRFVSRYGAATKDEDFIDKLGRVPVVYNAAIFNSLLIQLLAREAVDPVKAIYAQVASWEMLWGTSGQPGLLESLTGDERLAAEQVLEETSDRSMTLAALSACVDYELPSDLKAQLRSLAIHLVTDQTFGLGTQIIDPTAPNSIQAKALVDNLGLLTCDFSAQEIADYLVEPWGLNHRDTHWGAEEIMRRDPLSGKSYKSRCETLIINPTVEHLDCAAIVSALKRFVVATEVSGGTRNYWRIKFPANENALGYWDAGCSFGLSLVGDEEYEFEHLDVSLPSWFVRLRELSSAIGSRDRLSA